MRSPSHAMLFVVFTALSSTVTPCADIWVSPAGSDTTGTGTSANPYKTISFAESVASPGDTLFLTAGTFGDDEQILIGTKNITIVGLGVGVTTIVPHPSLDMSLPSGPLPGTLTNQRPVIAFDGARQLELRDLTIDCDFRMPASGQLSGIYVRNGGDAIIENVEILNARANPIDPSTQPMGVIVRGDSGFDRCEVVLRSSRVQGWGSDGVVASFNSNLQLEYCSVEGAGPQTAAGPVQSCVQINSGATGILRYNTITDARYAPAASSAAGIRLLDAGTCTIEVNRVARCDDNIIVSNTSGANVPVGLRHNRSTQAFGKALRIQQQTGVTVSDNVLHGLDLSVAPTWDATAGGNTWLHNNYSDWSGAGAYGITGGANVDTLPRRGLDEFAAPTMVPVGAGQQDVLAADLDGSGGLDFASISAGASPTLNVGLESGGSYTVSSLAFGTATAAAAAIAAGEFDGSAGTDLVAITINLGAATTENRFYIFANDGSGGFSLLHNEQLPAGNIRPRDVAAGNVDGTGVDDLVIAYSGDASNPGGATVLQNVSIGTAWSPTALAGPTLECKSVAIGAIDTGNSSLDIALTEGDGSTGQVRIYANGGGGVFAEVAVSPIGVPANPTGCALVDVDGDGDPEVLVSTWGATTPAPTGRVSILDNQLPAAMPVRAFPTDSGPTVIATGEVSFDSDPDTLRMDAVVVNTAGPTVTLLGELGGASPSQGALGSVGPSPTAVALADMNGDLLPDLLSVDGVLGNVAIQAGVYTPREDIYGFGCPGFRGRMPLIGSSGIPSVATQPNANFGIRMTNARASRPTALLFSLAPAVSVPCGFAVGTIVVSVATSTDAQGRALLPIPIPATPSFVGGGWFCQWITIDAPQGGLLGLASLTQGLRVRIGT